MSGGYLDCGDIRSFEATLPFSIELWIRPVSIDTSSPSRLAHMLTTARTPQGYILYLDVDGHVGFSRVHAGGFDDVKSSSTSGRGPSHRRDVRRRRDRPLRGRNAG